MCLQNLNAWAFGAGPMVCIGFIYADQIWPAYALLAAMALFALWMAFFRRFQKPYGPNGPGLPTYTIPQRIESMGKIAAGMAHEINGPLTVISGKVFRMNKNLRSMDPFCQSSNISSLKRDLKKINANIESISQLVQKIVSYTQGQGEFRIDAFNLQELKNKLKQAVAETFEQHYFEIIVPPQLHLSQCVVQGHQHLMERVILSVMENEVRLNRHERPWLELKFDTEMKNKNSFVLIRITHSGKNIDASVADKIFDPFYSSNDLGKLKALNLGTCRQVVKQHGGHLFHNTNHARTQFVITLPFIELDGEKTS